MLFAWILHCFSIFLSLFFTIFNFFFGFFARFLNFFVFLDELLHCGFRGCVSLEHGHNHSLTPLL